LHALETVVVEGGRVVDVGTGSGILLVAALQLGAEIAIGLDTDLSALPVALDNGLLNNLKLVVAAGSTEVIRSAWADVTVANISGTVLLAILDDLLRITRRGGTLVLTGFAESEAPTFANALPDATVSTMDGWSCVVGKIELA
jgi:ribosomal protein L11 methyltransferase